MRYRSCFERELASVHEPNEWCGTTHLRHSRSPCLVGMGSRHSPPRPFFLHKKMLKYYRVCKYSNMNSNRCRKVLSLLMYACFDRLCYAVIYLSLSFNCFVVHVLSSIV